MSWSDVFVPTMTGTQYTAIPSIDAGWSQNTSNGTWRESTNGVSYGVVASPGAARAYFNGAIGNDQAAECQIVGTSLEQEEGLLIRFTDGDPATFWGGTGYLMYVEAGSQLIVVRLDGGGSHTTLDSTSYSPSTGDVLRLEMVGTSWKAKVNAASFLIGTDATYGSGTVGLWAGITLDDTINLSIYAFKGQEQAATPAGWGPLLGLHRDRLVN